MQAGEFNKIVVRRQEKTHEVLVLKASEYANDKERFHNFKASGAMKGEVPELALWGFATKAIISIQDMIKRIQFGDHAPMTLGWIDEKIGDVINYLHLLEGLLFERGELLIDEILESDESLKSQFKEFHRGLGRYLDTPNISKPLTFSKMEIVTKKGKKCRSSSARTATQKTKSREPLTTATGSNRKSQS